MVDDILLSWEGRGTVNDVLPLLFEKRTESSFFDAQGHIFKACWAKVYYYLEESVRQLPPAHRFSTPKDNTVIS